MVEDEDRLRHMLDAAREIQEAVEKLSRDDLHRNHVHALGLVKCIEIIGEAASRVSPERQQQHPQLPWAEMTGMRNRLVHAYFEIDYDQLWQTATDDIPVLIRELEAILD